MRIGDKGEVPMIRGAPSAPHSPTIVQKVESAGMKSN
jgi:hypothetical protein